MTDSELKEVCKLPSGCTLYRKPNGVGGYRYYHDETGGGLLIWDTSLVSELTLLIAITEEGRRARVEALKKLEEPPLHNW
jgi:hypothetical protein